MTASSFCANCIEPSPILVRRTNDRGIKVWVCPVCADPAGALHIYDLREDNDGPIVYAAKDGNHRKSAHGG